jgi:hypothetical protein
MFDKSAAGKPGSAYWLGYVSVPDLEGAVERAKAARGSVLAGPMDVPGGDRIAQLMDPYGAFFALHVAAGQPAAAPAPKVGGTRKPAKKRRAKPAAAKNKPRKPAPKKKAARKPAKAKPRPKPAKKAAKKAPKKKTKKRTR